MSDRYWLEEVDHTGDAGIVVTAPDRRRLFERAAEGLFTIVVDLGHVEPLLERAIDVEGSDPEDLLVRWLSELNFIHLTEAMLFRTFSIVEMSDSSLSAKVHGERIDPARHTIYTEVKAVTYHGLRIVERADGWEAQIIFDM